jgi:hypothetical protein
MQSFCFPCSYLIFCFAQTGTSEHPANPPAAQPPADVQSLAKALAGTWSIAVRFGQNESIPNVVSKTEQSGGVARGEEVWRPGPGGFTLIDEEEKKMPNETVRQSAYAQSVLVG